MRIIKRSTLVEYAQRNPQAKAGLLYWHTLAESARWTGLQEVRRTFPHADAVTVASGRTVVIFNIAGNRYRLITAIHYDRQRVFTLRVMTHAEYSKDTWKEPL
jgi:mRNA interferase HigB